MHPAVRACNMHIENRLGLRCLANPSRRPRITGTAKHGHVQTLARHNAASPYLTTMNQFTRYQKVGYLFEQGGSCVRLPWGSR
jgi:hypothetical protein